MKKLFGRFVLLCLLTSCASLNKPIRVATLNQALVDPAMPIGGHSVLIADLGISINTVNGKPVYFNTIFASEGVMPLPPGNYVFGVRYGLSVNDNTTVRTTTTSEDVYVEHDFIAGHYYMLTAELGQSLIHFSVHEVTSPGEIKKYSSKIKKMKSDPAPFSFWYTSNDPTQFEGRWKTDDYSVELSITGNTYLIKRTGKSLFGNYEDTEWGHLTFADNTMMFYRLMQNNWKERRATAYTYMLDSDTLTLSVKRKVAFVFKRQIDSGSEK
jgi:hypothetical protein